MSNIPAEIQTVLQEMRTRTVSHNGSTSPTLAAWADRIEAALLPDKCDCIDCGGTQPGHIPSCEFMMELNGDFLSPKDYDMVRGTPRRWGAVEALLAMGWTWQDGEWRKPESNTESRSVEDLARQLFMDHRDPTGKQWFTVADPTREEWRAVARIVRAGKSWK